MERKDNVHLQEEHMYKDTENRYGIYQIIRGSLMDDYKFMRMDYVETSGGKVDKNGYQLVYTDRLKTGETLDSLYEKFNLYHPEDYMGHSLSVSDVVVLGIIYHDNKDPVFDGSEYSFIKGDVIHADGLDDVKHFAESPEVCRAVGKMQELFPDYQVIEPKSLQKAMYPENMTAEELADALMNLAEENDFYDYQDNFETTEEQKQRIVMDLGYGNKAIYIRNLKEMIEDDSQEAPRAKLLLNRIENYNSDQYPLKEPIVRIRYSERNEFKIGGYYTLTEAEKKIQEISAKENERASSTQNHDGQKENYLLDYTLYYEKNGEKQKLDGYLGIGSGGTGIVESIREQTEEKMSDTSWLNNIRSKGEEIYQSYMTELADIQEYVLPYLQQFVILPEREMISQSAQVIKKDGSVRCVVSNVGIKKQNEKKLSIHERIERNREILVGQNGRHKEVMEKERG